MEFIAETPSKRRRIDANYSFIPKVYDSMRESGEDLSEDYDTVATLPLPVDIPNQTNISLWQSKPTPEFITQPTQILNVSAPSFKDSHEPSVIQVAASSPTTKPAAESTSPAVHKLGASLANRMAPPGTAFRSPLAVPRPSPVIELSSDEDERPFHQREMSDEESQLNRNADIKPSKFIQSVQDETRLTTPNRFREITTQSFYKPTGVSQQVQAFQSFPQGSSNNLLKHSATSRSNGTKRSADVMADAYGRNRSTISRQAAPSTIQQQPGITLDDIDDFQVRKKVGQMHNVFPSVRIVTCKTVLLKKKGNFEDAMAALTSLDEQGAAINLTSLEHEHESHLQTGAVKLAAKQQLKAPAKSIQSKWASTQAFSQKTKPSSPSLTAPKRRKRLVKGLKKSPSPAVSRTSSPAGREPSLPIDLDTESDSALGPELDDVDIDRNVFDFLNTCTSEQLADIAAISEAVASTILSKKPFKSLDAVRRIWGESKPNAKRKNTRPIGDKIVETCIDMWKGYDAVDDLVRHCEGVGRPVVEQIKKWGVDVHGTTNEGELELVTFDQTSETSGPSMRDSGIGTPTSGPTTPDAGSETKMTRPTDKNAIFGQPRLMPKEVTLKDYQVVGVNWLALLFERKLSCILADDMGLGKTCQVIAFFAHLFETGNKGPHLVVVPGSTIENWLREFSIFCPKLSVMPYYAGQAERANLRHQIETNLPDINVIVTTYGVAKAKDDCRFLRKLSLQVCVYDEGHQLKNRKSTAFEQLTRLSSEFRLLLTGTPLQNNLSELVSLLAFIMPDIFREHSEDLEFVFSQKAKTNNEGHAALLSSQRINRARSMMAPFILRRKKHQVLKHLPQKTRRVEWCELSATQREVYNGEKARGLQVIADRAAGKKVGNETANVMMSLRKASIHPLLFRRLYDDKQLRKMARECLSEAEFKGSQYELCLEDMSVMNDFELLRFCERYPSSMSRYGLKNEEWMDSGKVTKLASLLQEYKSKGDRVLVFSQFVMVMDILEDVMETLGMRFFRLDGQTKIDERQDMIDQFHADASITVFLLSTKAGGAGINLACANRVVIFDSSFNPQDDIQAENRAHRVGQMRDVEVVRLVTKGTIEEQIHALGQTKLALDERVAGAGEASSMTVDDEKQMEKQGQQAVEELMIKELEAERDKK